MIRFFLIVAIIATLGWGREYAIIRDNAILTADKYKKELLAKYKHERVIIAHFGGLLATKSKAKQIGIIDRLESFGDSEAEHFFAFAKNMPRHNLSWEFYDRVLKNIRKSLDNL